jgi:hypothetical protein
MDQPRLTKSFRKGFRAMVAEKPSTPTTTAGILAPPSHSAGGSRWGDDCPAVPFMERLRETQATIHGVGRGVSDRIRDAVRDEQARLQSSR